MLAQQAERQGVTCSPDPPKLGNPEQGLNLSGFVSSLKTEGIGLDYSKHVLWF